MGQSFQRPQTLPKSVTPKQSNSEEMKSAQDVLWDRDHVCANTGALCPHITTRTTEQPYHKSQAVSRLPEQGRMATAEQWQVHKPVSKPRGRVLIDSTKHPPVNAAVNSHRNACQLAAIPWLPTHVKPARLIKHVNRTI